MKSSVQQLSVEILQLEELISTVYQQEEAPTKIVRRRSCRTVDTTESGWKSATICQTVLIDELGLSNTLTTSSLRDR